MTLTPKREIGSAGGSLPRRELPTGLRDGGGIFASETSGGQAIRCQTVQPAARLSANLRLLRRTRLCEADPSPGLWPPPFGLKGRRLNGQAKRLTYAKLECPMQDIHLQGGTCLRLFFNYEITNKHAVFRGSAAEPQLSILKSQISNLTSDFSIYLQKSAFRQKCWTFILFLIFFFLSPYKVLPKPLHFFRIMELRTTIKEVMNTIHRESTVKGWCFPREGAEV